MKRWLTTSAKALLVLCQLMVSVALAVETWEQAYHAELNSLAEQMGTVSRELMTVSQEAAELQTHAAEHTAPVREKLQRLTREYLETHQAMEAHRRQTPQWQVEQQKTLAKLSTWCGTVTLTRKKIVQVDNTDQLPNGDRCESQFMYEDVFKHTARWLCINMKKSSSVEKIIQPQYHHKMSRYAVNEKGHTTCELPEGCNYNNKDYCRYRVEPGNSTTVDEKDTKTLQGDAKATYRLGFLKKGYGNSSKLHGTLSFSARLPLRERREATETKRYACSGKTKTDERGYDRDWPRHHLNYSAKGLVIGDRFFGKVEEDRSDELIDERDGWPKIAKAGAYCPFFDLYGQEEPRPTIGLAVDKKVIEWDLRRMKHDCETFFNYFKGDVTLNGRPIELGAVSLDKGSVIQTGPRSKLEIRVADNAIIRLGSNSQFEVGDPCVGLKISPEATAKLWKGRMYAIVSRLIGERGSFEIRTGTAVIGIRGNFDQDELLPQPAQKFTWRNLLLPRAANATEKPGAATDLTEKDFVSAAVIVEIERIPGQSLRITAHKGSVSVHSSHGYAGTLEQGNTFTTPIVEGGDPADSAEYWVRIEVDPAAATETDNAASAEGG